MPFIEDNTKLHFQEFPNDILEMRKRYINVYFSADFKKIWAIFFREDEKGRSVLLNQDFTWEISRENLQKVLDISSGIRAEEFLSCWEEEQRKKEDNIITKIVKFLDFHGKRDFYRMPYISLRSNGIVYMMPYKKTTQSAIGFANFNYMDVKELYKSIIASEVWLKNVHQDLIQNSYDRHKKIRSIFLNSYDIDSIMYEKIL